MIEWIPVSYYPPEPSTPVMIRNGDEVCEGVYLDGMGYFKKGMDGWWKQVHATHWQKIHEPPKKIGEGEK